MTKGQRNERKAAECYQAAGYETYRPETSKWDENDVFGLYDMLAFKPGELRMIQVKTNRAAGVRSWMPTARAFESVSGVCVDFAVRHDREGWRLMQPTSDGYETVYDGRDSDANMGEGLSAFLSE